MVRDIFIDLLKEIIMLSDKIKKLIKKNNNLYSLIACLLNYRNLDFQKKVFSDSKPAFYGNIGYDPLINKKRCLISYITPENDDETIDSTSMTNIKEKYVIYNAFLELGYVLDICFCNDENIANHISQNNYDIIFGFGSAYRYAVEKWPKAFHIGYYTENPFDYSYEKEKERTDYYNKRHGANKKMYRTGRFYRKNEELLSDVIIHLCSPSVWNNIDVKKVNIIPHGEKRKDCSINYNEHRNSNCFLVYGNGGIIHKGIDILIDIFNNHPEWELYICGNSNEFDKYPELTPINYNIKICGQIDIESEKYNELIKKCTWVILPSCSEATATGVLTCMRHGLIPVVMREGMGFERFNDIAILMDDFHIDKLEEKLIEITSIDMNDLDIMSSTVFDFSNKYFTLERFQDDFTRLLQILV